MRGRPWCLVAVLAVAVPASAGAATEQVVATRGVGADLAVDDEGAAFVVSPSVRRGLGALPVVRARRAGPGAAFGRSRALLRSTRSDRVVHAGVAADGGGVIVVQSARRGHRRVRVVTFRARGRVGRPVTVSPGAGDADFAAAAVARTGAAVVVWFRHQAGRRWRLEAAVREPRAEAFDAPRPLTAFVRRACCTAVAVGIGERGDGVAAWSSTSRPGVWAALWTASGSFRSPQPVAEQSSDVPRVVVGAGGTAALLYSIQHVPRRATDGLQLHRAAGGGGFGAAEQVHRGCEASAGEAAVTPAGHVLVACVDDGDGRRDARVYVSEARPGEPLVAVGELGASVAPESLAVAADDDGRAIVAWPQRVATTRGYRERAVAAMRTSRNAPFDAAIALGSPSTEAEPGLARLVPRGGALVVWKAARLGRRTDRRVALTVTRLP